MISAKVRAPVRHGLLSGLGRRVLGEIWLGDTGKGRIRDTGICKMGKKENGDEFAFVYLKNIN